MCGMWDAVTNDARGTNFIINKHHEDWLYKIIRCVGKVLEYQVANGGWRREISNLHVQNAI